jgi:hypothetical protein
MTLAAAALLTLVVAHPVQAQYTTYYNGYNPYADMSMAYGYYGNPYIAANYAPQYYGSTFASSFAPTVYGYNPNVYGYNPNVYFSPSAYRQAQYLNGYNYVNPYQFRTYTYSYVR